MSTRIRYEIGPIPSVILVSDSEHAEENPEQVFRDQVRDHGLSLTGLARSLLNTVYKTDSGSHHAGDPMFSIEPAPTDYIKIVSVDYDESHPRISEKPGFA